jgi:hypothetical protein
VNRLLPIVPIFLLAIAPVAMPPMAVAESAAFAENAETMQSLLHDLEQIIEDADRRMVAHPTFLDELRALVQQYRDRMRQVFFSDDFSDGDYTHSPEWSVISGNFTVTRNKSLRSQVEQQYRSRRESKRKRTDYRDEAVDLILKEILGGSSSEETGERPSTNRPISYGQEAVIETRMPFAAAYEVEFTLSAEPSQGSMEVVLLGGEPARPRYRLVYHASPSEERPIEIVRDSGGRKYVIQAATSYPVLEDGIEHRIQWIRDTRGNMSVRIDGQSVLHTVELYYSDSFTGLALVNRGGAYEWDSIRILQPDKKMQDQ